MRVPVLLVAVLLETVLLAGCTAEEPVEQRREAEPKDRRGELVSDSLLRRASASELALVAASLGLPVKAEHGVEIHRIRYRTVDQFGAETIASGALMVPATTSGSFPLLGLQHGAAIGRASVASVIGFDPIGVAFAAGGYVTAMADYLGLGESVGLHPFVHARSLATAVVDMLRASRQFCERRRLSLNGQLFLAGYSEGGYATMAAQRAIEEEHAEEMTVTASAPMAGPYDLSGTMAPLIMSGRAYPGRYYLPYVLFAYNPIYRLFSSPEEIFRSPYARTLPPMFEGGRSVGEIAGAMPSAPRGVLRDSFVEAFERDPEHPLRRALRDNDLTGWTPRAPMRLYHCLADEIVPFQNSKVAYDAFRSRGADVELVPLRGSGHGGCAYPALVGAKQWLDSLRR